MTAERSDYPALLPQLQPPQAVDVLNDRVRQVGRLNTSIADWLQERRRLEEQYSAGLRKLARKSIDDVDLGIFSVPWSTLTGAADSAADSHAAFATKIEVDVERPLREFATSNREMQGMTTIQGNLQAMAKEVERAQQKTEKLRSKGERAETGRVSNAITELDTAQSQWDSQAPYVFENLQAVDEARLNHLRDVLTQFQTHEVDLVQKSQTTAEHCLNVLLSLQTEDEIKTFALKVAQNKPRVDRSRRLSVPAASPAPPLINRATPARQPGSSSNLAPTLSQQDNESQRSGSLQEEKKKSRFGGLKRLGTVVGGKRRESKQPALAPMDETPERKQKSSPFNSFGRLGGRSKDSNSLESPMEAPSRERPRSPLRMGSEIMEPSSGSAEPYSSPPRAQPTTNGTSSTFDGAPILPPVIPNGSHQGDLADLEPPKPEVQAPSVIPEAPKDSEGFTIPTRELDPISQAQADAGEGAVPAFNVNIRNAPIAEEGGDHEAALASVANKLQAPPPVVGRANTVRGRRARPVSMINSTNNQPSEQNAPPMPPLATSAAPLSTEQSREIASPSMSPAVQSPSSPIGAPSLSQLPTGALGASTFSPFSSAAGPSSPFRPESRIGASDHGADGASIRSGRSLGSTTSQALRHPELHDAGLNTSIVETVSAHFENGKLTSSSLIGEIAMAYNPTDSSATSSSENIRLENFASLEKVAPNPAFISPTPDKEGEYTVSLSSLSRTQVAFKYQVRTDDAGSQAPLLITPAFKIEPTQASIIVSYSLNPAFALHGRESITLSNVLLALTLEGAKATTCLSKPVGTFSREKNLMYWQLGEVTLTANAAPTKLLARFATETEARHGTVDAKWEISGEHAQGLGSGLMVSVGGASTSADPFADEEAGSGLTSVWKGVQGPKKLVSGAYQAK